MSKPYKDLRQEAAEKERKRQKALARQRARRVDNTELVTKEIDKLSNRG